MMKFKMRFSLLVCLLGVLCTPTWSTAKLPTGASDPRNTTMRVASYNIRYVKASDAETGDSWETRKEPVAELIRSQQFDVVGMQEGM